MREDKTLRNISIKIDDNNYKHFEVPHEVYTYIKQLETYMCILNPKEFYNNKNKKVS